MGFLPRPPTGCGGFFFDADEDAPALRRGRAGFFGLDFFFGLAFAFALDFAGALRLDLPLDPDLRDEEEREAFFRAAFLRVEVFFFAFLAFLLLAIRLNTDSR
jgi:hypothetical protein